MLTDNLKDLILLIFTYIYLFYVNSVIRFALEAIYI